MSEQSVIDLTKSIQSEVEKQGEHFHAAIKLLEDNNHESFKKAADEMAMVSENIQKLTAEKEALEKNIEAIEKRIARSMESASDSTASYLDYKKNLTDLLRSASSQKRLDAQLFDKDLFEKAASFYAKKLNISLKTVQESVDPDGGYLVLPEYSDERVMREFETSPIMQVANVIETNTNRVILFIDDDETGDAVWVEETQSPGTQSTPKVGELTIVAHKLRANLPATRDMIMDSSVDIVSWLANKARDKMTRQMNTSFVKGNGSKKPKGILSYNSRSDGGNSSYQRDTLIHVESGVNGQFTYDQLTDIQQALRSSYRSNAIWMINRRNWADILQLRDTQDRPLYQMTNLLQTGGQLVLLGDRVMFAEDVNEADGTTASTGNIIYGDFKGYTIVRRLGITVFVNPYINSATDIIRYEFTTRVGGALTNYESLIVGDNQV